MKLIIRIQVIGYLVFVLLRAVKGRDEMSWSGLSHGRTREENGLIWSPFSTEVKRALRGRGYIFIKNNGKFTLEKRLTEDLLNKEELPDKENREYLLYHQSVIVPERYIGKRNTFIISYLRNSQLRSPHRVLVTFLCKNREDLVRIRTGSRRYRRKLIQYEKETVDYLYALINSLIFDLIRRDRFISRTEYLLSCFSSKYLCSILPIIKNDKRVSFYDLSLKRSYKDISKKNFTDQIKWLEKIDYFLMESTAYLYCTIERIAEKEHLFTSSKTEYSKDRCIHTVNLIRNIYDLIIGIKDISNTVSCMLFPWDEVWYMPVQTRYKQNNRFGQEECLSIKYKSTKSRSVEKEIEVTDTNIESIISSKTIKDIDDIEEEWEFIGRNMPYADDSDITDQATY